MLTHKICTAEYASGGRMLTFVGRCSFIFGYLFVFIRGLKYLDPRGRGFCTNIPRVWDGTFRILPLARVQRYHPFPLNVEALFWKPF